MARLLRVEFPGAIYHVTIRGNGRRLIFLDSHDRERFLKRLADSVEDYNTRVYLFCLMRTHAHLVLETQGANLSRFMQSLETGYTVYFNLRHRTVGHLMQGRYGAKLVAGDEYLLKLSRYVHLNPIFVDSVKDLPLTERIAVLRAYPWSSYRSYIGLARELGFVDYGPMLSLVRTKKAQARRQYREFVERGIAREDEDFQEALRASRLSIGEDEFREWVDKRYMDLVENSRRPEDIEFRKEMKHLSSDEVLSTLSECLDVDAAEFRRHRRDSVLRPVAAKMLSKYSGLTNRKIAGILGMNRGSTVGWQIRKTKEWLAGRGENRQLRKRLQEIENALSRKLSKV